MIVLEVASGAGAGTRIEAGPGTAVEIGRETLGRTGAPADRHMSARHFVIAWGDDGRYRIRDLGSTNGTLVNGSRVTEAVLQDGDRIEAGRTVFIVRANSQPGVVPSPAPPPMAPAAGSGRDASRSAPPVLQIINPSPLSVATIHWEDEQKLARLSVIVKATFSLADPARLAPEQCPIFPADVIAPPPSLSPRFESDLVPFKPRADVVLVGRAYAPGGQPVTQLMAGLRVGDLRYGVTVFGDRTWQWLPIAPTISTPEPFTSMDLVYDRAFGGIDGPGGMYCKDNLAGTGFIGKNTRERVSGLRLPNIEDPRNLITGWQTHPRPAGLGFYGRGWTPRLAYAGTYDEKYMKERHPLPPSDFSYRFFNGAHPDLQVEGYLRGDEEVVLVNVCPHDPDVRFRLPGIVPTITVARWAVPPEQWIEEHRDPDGSLPDALPLNEESVTPVLDTLVFVPDQGIFYEVFRGVCRLSSLDSLEVARVTIGR